MCCGWCFQHGQIALFCNSCCAPKSRPTTWARTQRPHCSSSPIAIGWPRLSEWGLYELLLTALTEAATARFGAEVRDWLNGLRREAITDRNALLARRHVELATRVLCREHGLRLCFILDEFDASYRTLSPAALANLRAVRDADRYSRVLCLDAAGPPRTAASTRATVKVSMS